VVRIHAGLQNSLQKDFLEDTMVVGNKKWLKIVKSKILR